MAIGRLVKQSLLPSVLVMTRLYGQDWACAGKAPSTANAKASRHRQRMSSAAQQPKATLCEQVHDFAAACEK